jgi:hypothetical protein
VSKVFWAAALECHEDPAAALVQRRKALRQERQQLSKELKNAERKRARLIERARGLSDKDIMSLMGARAAKITKAKAKAKAKAKPRADA